MGENKKQIDKAFWIFCKWCKCEYLESIDSVQNNNGITECPSCHKKLIIK